MGVSILCLCTKELEKVDIDSFIFVKFALLHRYTLRNLCWTITADKEDSTFMISWSLTPEITFKCLMREGVFVANRSKMLWPWVGVKILQYSTHQST